MTDYTNARFYAISSIGYGKGFTAEEAIENYVATQMRSYSWKTTIFKSKKEWEAALRTGDAQAQVWQAPEGAEGFVLSTDGIFWTMPKGSPKSQVQAKPEQRVS
jgi:hypothetical protein